MNGAKIKIFHRKVISEMPASRAAEMEPIN
jgi:hypothetical protein